MTWYHAADGKQAGPFNEEQFGELIANGTVQPATLVWEARLPNWVPLSQVPPGMLPPTSSTGGVPGAPPVFGAGAIPGGIVCNECGRTFPPDEVIRIADRNVCATCKPILVQRLSEGAAPASVAGLWVTEQQLLDREYRVEIGSSLERAWNLFKNNAGPIIGATVLVGLTFLAGSAISSVVSMVIPMGNVFLQPLYAGPLIGGLMWYFLRLARGEGATIADAFAGFSRCFLQLFLASLVQTLIMVACLIPLIILAVIGGAGMAITGRAGGGISQSSSVGLIIGLVIGGLVAMCLIVYFGVCWAHSFLLIIDKRMNFWPAMRLSRRMVQRRWWMSFLLLFVAGLVQFAGVFACFIGLLITVPLYYGMKIYFYEDNFRDLQPSQP